MSGSAHRIHISTLVVLAPLLLWSGCGDTGQPGSGYADPCATPMGPLLDCPYRGDRPPLSAAAACRKLVSCGILADSYLLPLSTRCESDDDCDTEQGRTCRTNAQGTQVCHYHRMDLFWCTYQLTHRATDPCDRGQSYTTGQVGAAISCIGATSCQGLGLPLTQKLIRASQRPLKDSYHCDDKDNTLIWTATVCDHGLLYYGSGR